MTTPSTAAAVTLLRDLQQLVRRTPDPTTDQKNLRVSPASLLPADDSILKLARAVEAACCRLRLFQRFEDTMTAALEERLPCCLPAIPLPDPRGGGVGNIYFLSRRCPAWHAAARDVLAELQAIVETKTKGNRPSKDRIDDILTTIRQAGVPLTRSELVEKMKRKTVGKLGKNLTWLVQAVVLVKVPSRGYWPASDPIPMG